MLNLNNSFTNEIIFKGFYGIYIYTILQIAKKLTSLISLTNETYIFFSKDCLSRVNLNLRITFILVQAFEVM